MLKSDLVQTDKHSIKILLRRKNLRFLRRTNLIKTHWATLLEKNRIQKNEQKNILSDNIPNNTKY